MKKFILRVTAVLLVTAALLWAGGAAYKQTNDWKNRERNEETDKYRDMPETVSFAVLGPSHSRDAFRAEDWGDGFFNFAMSSQTPQYDLMQLREFSDRIAPGATVVLTMTYLSPFWTDSEENFAAKQERYYRILSPENIVDCDVGRWALGRFSPLLTTDAGDMLGAFLAPEALRPTSDELYGRETLTEDELPTERERMERDRPLIEPNYPGGNPVQMQAFEQMLSLCREKGWNAVLVMVPYPQVYHECFSPALRESVRETGQSLAESYGVPWLDYSQDEEFAGNFDYFKNIDHLNIAGANTFAAKLRPALREMGYLQE